MPIALRGKTAVENETQESCAKEKQTQKVESQTRCQSHCQADFATGRRTRAEHFSARTGSRQEVEAADAKQMKPLICPRQDGIKSSHAASFSKVNCARAIRCSTARRSRPVPASEICS